MRIQIDQLAADEAAAAALWYDRQRMGLGTEFLRAIDDTIAVLAANPDAGSMLETLLDEPNVLRLQVRRFPYLVIYEKGHREIRVVAIAHTRRRPDYWKNR
jgi:plasmid stabilization system protein ParE